MRPRRGTKIWISNLGSFFLKILQPKNFDFNSATLQLYCKCFQVVPTSSNGKRRCKLRSNSTREHNLANFCLQTEKNRTGVLTRSIIPAIISPLLTSWTVLKFHTRSRTSNAYKCTPTRLRRSPLLGVNLNRKLKLFSREIIFEVFHLVTNIAERHGRTDRPTYCRTTVLWATYIK